jgi:hypothetical protein
MHRMKIGLFAALVLLLVTFGVYVAVTNSLRENATESTEQDLLRAERAFAEIGRLRAADAAMQAFERAKRPSVVAVFSKSDETARREEAFKECEALNAGLQKEGRKAAIVAILDSGGKVVARDLNPNAMFGEPLVRDSSPSADAIGSRFRASIKNRPSAVISRRPLSPLINAVEIQPADSKVLATTKSAAMSSGAASCSVCTGTTHWPSTL